jgi:DNA-binding response OmpR family regulator
MVFISGWDDPVLRRDAAELGAMYLQKPIKAAELLAALHEPTRRPQLRPQRHPTIDKPSDYSHRWPGTI